MNTDRDPTDSATQRALRLEERNFDERYRFEARAHGVQQVETAATSTLAHVQQFAVASLMAPVFELPLSDVTIVDGEKAVLECRVAATPAAEVTWYVDNVFTADGWCRLIIRDVMLKDEAEYTVRAVNEAGTCISTAYLTVLPATAGERTAKELIEQESTGVTVTIRSPRPHSLFAPCLQRHFRFVSAQDI